MSTQRKYRLFRRNGRWQHNHYGETDGFCELYLTLTNQIRIILKNKDALTKNLIENENLADCLFPKNIADEIKRVNKYLTDFILNDNFSSFKEEYNLIRENDRNAPDGIDLCFLHYIDKKINEIYSMISIVE